MHLLTVTKASFWIYSCIKQTSKDGDSIRCFSHCHVVIINYHFFKILLFEKSTRLKNIWFVSRVMSRVLDSWVEPLNSFRACWRVWFFADFRFFYIEDVPASTCNSSSSCTSARRSRTREANLCSAGSSIEWDYLFIYFKCEKYN